MFRRFICVTCMASLAATATTNANDGEDIRSALKPFNSLVGEWKGTATPKDAQSRRDRAFWREEGEWVWVLEKDRTGLIWSVKDGKKFKGGFLTFVPNQKAYRFDIVLADDSKLTFDGELDAGILTMYSRADDSGQWQLRLRPLHENRHLVYLAHRKPQRRSYRDTLMTGYTRQGVQFASSSTGPECIVTGGRGSMQVSYQGKRYYVCCTGCKQAFEDDPEKYIAELAKKKRAK